MGSNSEAHALAIVTTVGCKFCKKTKAGFKEAGVKYEEVEVSKVPGLLPKIKALTGHTTVPQVFCGGVFVGGSDKTLELLGKHELLSQGQPGVTALPIDLHELVDEGVKNFEKEQSEAHLPPGVSLKQYDEAKQLAADMLAQRAGLFGKNRIGLHSYPDTARLDQVIKLAPLGSDPMAKVSLLQRAQMLGVIAAPKHLHNAQGDVDLGSPHLGGPGSSDAKEVLVRLTAMAPNPKLGQAMNGKVPWYGEGRDAEQVAGRLRQNILVLYERHLTEDAHGVRYSKLKQDPDFRNYTNAASELQRVDLFKLSADQRKALFINLYNAIIIAGTAEYGPATNALGRLRWWAGVKYNIGGQDYSTFDMEHGILRGNASQPSLLAVIGPSGGPSFKDSDPRQRLSVPVDPRIHSALVCGAKSCPPIQLYTAANLDQGLTSAATAFIEGAATPVGNTVKLSSIFKWYAADFGGKSGTLAFLHKHSSGERAQEYARLQAMPESSVTFEFLPYDWTPNVAE